MRRSRNYRASDAKGQKYDSDSDSDSEYQANTLQFGDLEPVHLTEEEKEEFQDSVYFTSSSGSDNSRSPSGSPPRPLEAVSQQPYVHSHKKLLEFLLTTGSVKSEILATNKWNSEAPKVYKLFNITKRIVHPDYFFASEALPDNKTTTILVELEKMNMKKASKTYYPWSYLKECLKPFLDSFVGLEKLANVFHVHEIAVPLKNKLALNIERAEMNANDGWYEPFTDWTRTLAEEPNDVTEGTFLEYIETLFKQLSVITYGRFSLRSQDLKLILPAQNSQPEKKLSVKPDIMVRAKFPGIMLVGEVKQFGCSGLKNQKHRDRTVRLTQPDISNLTLQTELDTDQPRGQGDKLSPNVTEKEKSVPCVTADEPHATTTVTSKETDQLGGQGDQLPPPVNEKDQSVPSLAADEPCAGTSKEQTGSSTESKPSTIPSRYLNCVEEFKVSKYLPQLFGQMLAALERNERSAYRFRFCQMYESVQFGFAVEGFKLRFVKLTMIDVLKKERPTVRALLSGKMIKCHISITQEFNLLKKRHLEMFYQMLLAMRYLCC